MLSVYYIAFLFLKKLFGSFMLIFIDFYNIALDYVISFLCQMNLSLFNQI